MEIKNFIQTHLFNSLGRLDSNRIKKEWFLKRGFDREFYEIENSDSQDISISQKIYNIYNEMETPICKWCNKNPVKFINFILGYREYCSCKCSSNSDEKQEKIKETCFEKYGVSSPTKHQPIKDKIKETCFEKYGVGAALQSKIVKDKIKETCFEKYGVPNANQKNINSETLEKLNSPEWLIDQHHTQQKTCMKIAEELNVTKRTVLNYAAKHNIEPMRFSVSSGEREIMEFLSQYTTVETCRRDIISPAELDIFLPEFNVAVEYNGVYWHSENHKDKKYHINKTKRCEDLGIKLIQVFDDEWNNKPEIVKSILLSKLGIFEKQIYARKCTIINKNAKEIRKFIEDNHIQGNTKAESYYCLYYGDELVSVASIGKGRYKQGTYELIRFCTKLNYSVYGGFSKLLNTIKKDYPEIYSYTDLRLFNGNVYSKFGTFIKRTDPGYFWTDGVSRISRYRTQKKKLEKILGTKFDPTLTERQNMINAGYLKIFDCGNDLYLL